MGEALRRPWGQRAERNGMQAHRMGEQEVGGGDLLASYGTLVVQIYTSDARIPLQGAGVALIRRSADGERELLAFRLSNYDGMTEPITIETPEKAESQQSGAKLPPFASVDIEAEVAGYDRILIRDAQIFAGEQTIQPLRLIPTPSLPESYTRTQVFTVTPQNL